MEFLIHMPRPSAIIMNRKGERGSPCLIPLEERKVEVGMPFMRIEKKADDIRLLTHRIPALSKPKAFKTFCMYSQLMLSKAFERSILRSIPGFFYCLREWMIS